MKAKNVQGDSMKLLGAGATARGFAAMAIYMMVR
jgi:hypothetical protein